MKAIGARSNRRGTKFAMTGLAVAAGLWCLAPLGVVRAHEDNGKPPQGAVTANMNLQVGIVTSVNSGQIRINDTNYPLDAHVTVSDDEGRPRELKAVVPDAHVQYHVHHGHVDHIILVLPR